jgi:hypothetical protein
VTRPTCRRPAASSATRSSRSATSDGATARRAEWRETLRRFLPGLWLGLIAGVALIATPAPFATLAPADAGRVVRRVFEVEAPTSLALGVLMLMLERRSGVMRHAASGDSQFTPEMMFVLGALFCTVLGHYGLQPLMAQARAGEGGIGFGRLHLASTVLFGLKGLLVGALAWRPAAAHWAFFLALVARFLARLIEPPAVTR